MISVALGKDVGASLQKQVAYCDLMRSVFGFEPIFTPKAPWEPLALFDSKGRCVAGLEIGFLPLVLDNKLAKAAAIRSAATDPAHRGKGLFRELMARALSLCEAQNPAAILLYTEDPALYERFGFQSLVQHAFVGSAPIGSPSSKARRLTPDDPRDQALIRDLVERRTAVSQRCAILVDADVFLTNVAADPALSLAYIESIRTLVVFERYRDNLFIIDVVATDMPPLSALIGDLAPDGSQVTCLFPPDKLDWAGEPVAEDTGLMIGGKPPPAMRHPFMFPPTAEF